MTNKLNRKDICLRAESIRVALQSLSSRLDDLTADVGGAAGWPSAYETLLDVQSDIDRCAESLANRFPQR